MIRKLLNLDEREAIQAKSTDEGVPVSKEEDDSD